MSIILETPRLILREMTLEDAPFMFYLNSDELVVRYTGDAAFESLTDAENIVRYVQTQYTKHGIGRWVVQLKDGEPIGWCGLKYDEDIAAVDLGYRLVQSTWGKGYATEAAQACVRYAFDTKGITKLIGRVMIGNVASSQVLTKCGFQLIRTETCGNQPGLWYELERPL